MRMLKIFFFIGVILLAQGQETVSRVGAQQNSNSSASTGKVKASGNVPVVAADVSQSNSCSSGEQNKMGTCVPETKKTRDNQTEENQNASEIDLLLKEISELETQITLNRQKVELLSKVRAYYTKNNMTIPVTHCIIRIPIFFKRNLEIISSSGWKLLLSRLSMQRNINLLRLRVLVISVESKQDCIILEV